VLLGNVEGLILLAFIILLIANVSELLGCIIARPLIIGGMIVLLVGILLIRLSTRPFKDSYEGCAMERVERSQNRKRWKRKWLMRRILIWIPSAIAAFVLLFFPVMSHVLFPRAGQLPYYCVSLPWNWVVMPGKYFGSTNWGVWADIFSGYKTRFGPMPPFRQTYLYREAYFLCIPPWKVNAAHQHTEEEVKGFFGRPGTVRRELLVGDTRILCWEIPGWVRCITPLEEKMRAFEAGYRGPPEALPAFYEAIRTMKPVN
jgi:hypothetical protein